MRDPKDDKESRHPRTAWVGSGSLCPATHHKKVKRKSTLKIDCKLPYIKTTFTYMYVSFIYI